MANKKKLNKHIHTFKVAEIIRDEKRYVWLILYCETCGYVETKNIYPKFQEVER